MVNIINRFGMQCVPILAFMHFHTSPWPLSMSTIVWSLRPVRYGLYGSDHCVPIFVLRFLFSSCWYIALKTMLLHISNLAAINQALIRRSHQHYVTMLLQYTSHVVSKKTMPYGYTYIAHACFSFCLLLLRASMVAYIRGRPFMQHFRTFSQALIEWPPFSLIMHAPNIALLSNTSIHFLKHFHALNFLI